MWLIISTPSNPASLMAFIFSTIVPFMSTVAHMIALRIVGCVTDAVSAPKVEAVGESADVTARTVEALRKSRRFIRCFCYWSLGFGASLEFGVWNLKFLASECAHFLMPPALHPASPSWESPVSSSNPDFQG